MVHHSELEHIIIAVLRYAQDPILKTDISAFWPFVYCDWLFFIKLICLYYQKSNILFDIYHIQVLIFYLFF